MKALSYFQDAIELDPQCADAYAGLADTYISLSYNHLLPSREAAARAHEAINAALQANRNSTSVGNAHINLLMHCDWNLEAAERKCREMIDSKRMDERTLQLLSSLMSLRGRHREAIRLALDCNRGDPQSEATPNHVQVSVAYFYAGDYSNALSSIRSTVERQPHHAMGHALLGRIEAQLGNWDQAIAAFECGLNLSEHSMFNKALLAYAYAGRGEASKARLLLRELEGDSSSECYPEYDVSAAHAVLNEEQEALNHLQRACQARNVMTIFAGRDPRFARLRNTSGFQQIATSISPHAIALPTI